MTNEEAITKLQSQVQRAHRRITLQRFVTVLAWSLFATLLISAVGLVVPKIWAIGIKSTVWTWSWIFSSTAAGLLLAGFWTYWTRSNLLQTAIEVDQRFDLKERVSSCLTLGEAEIDGQAGKALLTDATRRVERIDVMTGFPLQVDRRALLPLIPALIVFIVVTFLPDAQKKKEAEAARTKQQIKKQIIQSIQQAKKKAEEKKKKAEELGLKEAQDVFDKLTKGLEDLHNLNDGNRRNALRQLSDLSAELKKRQQRLGGADEMKKQFSRLKNLKPGPANEFSKAVKKGDFHTAIQSLKDLKTTLEAHEMSGEKREDLAEQLQQMFEKMQQMAGAHQQAKRQLQQKIAEAKNQGDNDEVNKLQEKLDKLNQQNRQMDQIQQMAQKLGQCSQCMGQGQGKLGQGKSASNMQQAMAQLDQLTQNLQQMQQTLDELDMLEEALDQISMSKNAMNCKQCGGTGCSACNSGIGMGMGEGQGKGDRPEEQTDAKFYDSKVKTDPKGGKAVITGEVRGRNIVGDTQIEIKEQFEAFKGSQGDSLTNKRLPKARQDHVREYISSMQGALD